MQLHGNGSNLLHALAGRCRRSLPAGVSALLFLAGLPVGVAAATAGAANWQPPAQVSPYTLPRSEQRILTSKQGDEYQIMISWPDGDPPPEGFPVVYVLDGNAAFGMLTETSRRLTRPYGPDHRGLRAPLVVAIGYPGTSAIHRERRTFDYTPPASHYADAGGMRVTAKQGGADQFLDFIEQTLKPAVEADYPVDPAHQILMGHSFGGLFVLHTLFTRPQAFQSYVAISPSIWWNDRYVLKEAEQFVERQKVAPVQATVQISLGEREQGGRSQASDGRQSAAELLARRLQGLEDPGLDVSFRVHTGETHGSVMPIALARALPAALSRPVTAGRQTVAGQADTQDTETLARLLKPFPAAKPGQVRWVIELPALPDEDGSKVELLPGKRMEVDCNRRWGASEIERRTLEGWGYDYLVMDAVGPIASTMMACLDTAPSERFVPVGNLDLLRYNSRMPIVFYAPEGVELRYRVWKAQGSEGTAARQ